MPQSANINVCSDKSPCEIQSYDDENANLKVSFTSNNAHESATMFHDDDEENALSTPEDFFENFHAGYKRESEHR